MMLRQSFNYFLQILTLTHSETLNKNQITLNFIFYLLIINEQLVDETVFHSKTV